MTYQNQLTAQSPIKVTKHADRTRTVTYFDKVVGHYAPVRHIRAGERRWRCVSVHGQLAYAWSETHARNVLMELYH